MSDPVVRTTVARQRERERQRLLAMLGRQRARYRFLQVADVYKWLHQAALGPAHFVTVDDARSRLAAEAAALAQGPGPEAPGVIDHDSCRVEPLVEVISPDGRLVRLNLRPYVRLGGDLDDLAEAFAATAADFPRSPATLMRLCAGWVGLAAVGDGPLPTAMVAAYVRRRAAEGWPPAHHSSVYRRLYRPAYRVVDARRLPRPSRT